jgi:hypothetical protein
MPLRKLAVRNGVLATADPRERLAQAIEFGKDIDDPATADRKDSSIEGSVRSSRRKPTRLTLRVAARAWAISSRVDSASRASSCEAAAGR